MSIYSGSLNQLSDGVGSVIPITLNPGDVPGDGLIIDISRLQPPIGNFGPILGLTVDATATNISAAIATVYFQGSNLTRTINGGNTQVYRVPGNCLRITITKLAWSGGPINFILWNTTPPGEAGAPVVQFAAGQAVTITAGNVGITGTVTIEPGAHQLAIVTQTPVIGQNQYALVPNTTNGTIRSIFLNATSAHSLGPEGSLQTRIGNVALTSIYWQARVSVTNRGIDYIDITTLGGLAIPFTGGLVLDIITFSLVYIDSQMLIDCVVGWN